MLLQSKKLRIGLGIVLITILLSFFIFGAMINNMVNAADEEKVTTKDWVVTDLGDASRIAGYPIVTLNNVPIDLQAPKNFEIWETPDKAKATMQIWGTYDLNYPFIIFVQDPSCAGIIRGQPFQIGNIQGERLLIQGKDGIPDRLVFYWRDGEMTYQIFGTLLGSVNEDTLIQLANSVSTK
jgi:hypothetical protein